MKTSITTTTASAKKNNKEQGWNTNTVLSCVLKTMLRSDRTMKSGKEYQGVLRRDAESEDFNYDVHYTFTEALHPTTKRNARLFDGKFITITRWDDGSLHPNFKVMKMGKGFSIERYATGVRRELREGLKGLIEEK